ncbi:MAG: EF-hand domain-containing protein [Alphaproteobacteria bacterium]
MIQLSKIVVFATAALVFMGATRISAESETSKPAELWPGIQSKTVIPGATPQKLMERDDAAYDTGLDIFTDADERVNIDSENDKRFENIDTNQDGYITRQQFSNSIDADTSAETFKEFDTDNDSYMSEAEYEAYLEADINTNYND